MDFARESVEGLLRAGHRLAEDEVIECATSCRLHCIGDVALVAGGGGAAEAGDNLQIQIDVVGIIAKRRDQEGEIGRNVGKGPLDTALRRQDRIFGGGAVSSDLRREGDRSGGAAVPVTLVIAAEGLTDTA